MSEELSFADANSYTCGTVTVHPIEIQWNLAPKERSFMCRGVIEYDVESGGGFWCYARNLPGCASQGVDIVEAKKMLRDAFELMVDYHVEEGIPIQWKCYEEWSEIRPTPNGFIYDFIYERTV